MESNTSIPAQPKTISWDAESARLVVRFLEVCRELELFTGQVTFHIKAHPSDRKASIIEVRP